jgi:hypothetical protein
MAVRPLPPDPRIVGSGSLLLGEPSQALLDRTLRWEALNCGCHLMFGVALIWTAFLPATVTRCGSRGVCRPSSSARLVPPRWSVQPAASRVGYACRGENPLVWSPPTQRLDHPESGRERILGTDPNLWGRYESPPYPRGLSRTSERGCVPAVRSRESQPRPGTRCRTEQPRRSAPTGREPLLGTCRSRRLRVQL